MKLSKILLKPAAVLCVISGLLFYPKLIPNYTPSSPNWVYAMNGQLLPPKSTPTNNSVTGKQVNPGLPVRLKIPKINVNAGLEYVGLTPQGEVGVPTIAANAAWYDSSPLPGQKGSAVIDGHSGWLKSLPAVFDNLHKLQTGDKLYVEDENEIITVFVVRELRTFGQNDIAPDVFNSSDGLAHLNLITCQGQWNQARESYPSRFVVFTDKV